MIYRLYVAGFMQTEPNAAMTIDANPCVSFLFDPANTDYQQFKIQVASGMPLEDPEGNVMMQDEVDDFLRTIP
jgi:hypothetical protein